MSIYDELKASLEEAVEIKTGRIESERSSRYEVTEEKVTLQDYSSLEDAKNPNQLKSNC
ncbi:hypothetical protein [Aeromonas veronii]|uniref:hypothetical protein n=1 Tax=Aeromonas veronii TaxID=654 RepID=UPI003A38C982